MLEEIEEGVEEEEEELRASDGGSRGRAAARPDCAGARDGPAQGAGGGRRSRPTSTTRGSDDGLGSGEWEEREAPPLENTLTREPDLYDHLLWQIHLSDFAPVEREIAELIVGNLDPDGFLVASVEEIAHRAASAAGEPWSEDLVRAVLDRGAAARSAGHRLRQPAREPAAPARHLRASRRTRSRGGSSSKHWDLFLRRQYPQIARALGVAAARARAGDRADQGARDAARPSLHQRASALHRARRLRHQGRRRLRHPAQRRRAAAPAHLARLPPHAAADARRTAARTRPSSTSPTRCAPRSG